MGTLPWCLAAMSLAVPVTAEGARAPSPWAEYRAEPQVQRAGAPKNMARAKLAASSAPVVKLAPPSPEEADRVLSASRAGAAAIGVPRPVPALQQDPLALPLRWQALPNGAHVANFALQSPEAQALRVGLFVKAVPPGAILRFHGGPSPEAFEVTGLQMLEAIADNLEAGEEGADARTYWSPVIEGHAAVIEIELPAGAVPADLHIRVTRVSHLLTSAARGFAAPKSTSCGIDAGCHADSWGGPMSSVTRVLFTREGVTYACSGTLLADQDPRTEIPYLATAAHCISGQATASTVSTYWFQRSSACGGEPRRFEVRHGGAAVLHVDSTVDTTLLRLHSAPPSGAVYAGWLASPGPPLGAAVTGIHYAATGQQEISFGELATHARCMVGVGDKSICTAGTSPEGGFYYVTWRRGLTHAGASGSGLFADQGRHLVGLLSSGTSTCSADSSGDFYARFHSAYHGGLHRWLGASPSTSAGEAPAGAPPPLRLRLSTRLAPFH